MHFSYHFLLTSIYFFPIFSILNQNPLGFNKILDIKLLDKIIFTKKSWKRNKGKLGLNWTISDFEVSTVTLNPVEIFRRWCRLNFGLLRGHVKSCISLPFDWKDRREETIFLLFKRISWNNWLGMTLDNPL